MSGSFIQSQRRDISNIGSEWNWICTNCGSQILESQKAIHSNFCWAATQAGGGGNPDHAAYVYLAASMEPLAIEQAQTATFSYTINSGVTKLIVNAFNTQLAGAGRWELRNPRVMMPLRNIGLAGLGSDSCAVIIDPAAPTYTDARTTYLDRLNMIATKDTKQITQSLALTCSLFLPGPYGNIITSVNSFNATWIIIRLANLTSAVGWNLHDEVGDAAAQAINLAHPCMIPVSKLVCTAIELGTESSIGTPNAEGSITHIICPSDWGKVTDSNSYIFRDDFMGASLDTVTNWTRAQSSVGNVEIDTNFAWLKLIGNGVWGNNGCFSQTTTARANGKKFECWVYISTASTLNHNFVVGWHDGGGQSFSDFAHGLDFTNDGAARRLEVFENGNDRGFVGVNPGYTEGYIYRVRITLGSSNNATYEIQGGPQYAPLGGSNWTNITPVTTSSSTTPLAIGATRLSPNGTDYISDMKMF